MATKMEMVEQLITLVQINNDRIAGYERAAADLDDRDVDLKALFRSMANDSKKYVSELTEILESLGEQSSTESTMKGKVYRAWMDVKNAFAGSNRQDVLNSCEYGEDEAQKAYLQVLYSDVILPAETRFLIADQQVSLKTAHDLIKTFKNARQPVTI